MLIAVAGSSGLGQVVGISATHPAALLRAVGDRPDERVVLLAPWYAAPVARAQAHVVLAACPRARVCVLPLAHHALTLTLLGVYVLEAEGEPAGWSEPNEAVQLLHQAAARTRSVVWYPRVLGLRDPAPALAQRLRSLGKAPGYFLELGPGAGLERGRRGLAPRSGENLYAAVEPSPLLRSQLAGTDLAVVSVVGDAAAPYATATSSELTGLVQPAHPPVSTESCPSCSARCTAAGCAFCGSGPRAARADGSTRPQTTERGGQVEAEEGVAA